MKKDTQFMEMLELNAKLVDLGKDLVSSIEDYGLFDTGGVSPHMLEAIINFKELLRKEYTSGE